MFLRWLELLDPLRYRLDLRVRQRGRPHWHAGSHFALQHSHQHALLGMTGDNRGTVAGAPREQPLKCAQVQSAQLAVRAVAGQTVLREDRLDFGTEGISRFSGQEGASNECGDDQKLAPNPSNSDQGPRLASQCLTVMRAALHA